MTGLITNMLRKSASPASTWFGGTPFNPSALRVRPSTTKILVKLVISSRMDGATESSVSSSRMLTEVLGLGDRFTPMVPAGGVGAVGLVGPAGARIGVIPVSAALATGRPDTAVAGVAAAAAEFAPRNTAQPSTASSSQRSNR